MSRQESRWPCLAIVLSVLSVLGCARTPPPGGELVPAGRAKNPPIFWSEGGPDLGAKPNSLAASDGEPPEPEPGAEASPPAPEVDRRASRVDGLDLVFIQRETEDMGIVDLRVELGSTGAPILELPVDIEPCFMGYVSARLIDRSGNKRIVDLRLECELGGGRIRQYLTHHVVLLDSVLNRSELLWTGSSTLMDGPEVRAWEWHRFAIEGDTLVVRLEQGEGCDHEDDRGLWSETWTCPIEHEAEVARVPLKAD